MFLCKQVERIVLAASFVVGRSNISSQCEIAQVPCYENLLRAVSFLLHLSFLLSFFSRCPSPPNTIRFLIVLRYPSGEFSSLFIFGSVSGVGGVKVPPDLFCQRAQKFSLEALPGSLRKSRRIDRLSFVSPW